MAEATQVLAEAIQAEDTQVLAEALEEEAAQAVLEEAAQVVLEEIVQAVMVAVLTIIITQDTEHHQEDIMVHLAEVLHPDVLWHL